MKSTSYIIMVILQYIVALAFGGVVAMFLDLATLWPTYVILPLVAIGTSLGVYGVGLLNHLKGNLLLVGIVSILVTIPFIVITADSGYTTNYLPENFVWIIPLVSLLSFYLLRPKLGADAEQSMGASLLKATLFFVGTYIVSAGIAGLIWLAYSYLFSENSLSGFGIIYVGPLGGIVIMAIVWPLIWKRITK